MNSEDIVDPGTMPGLTEKETARMLARPPRCGECAACVLVEESKALFMPNPPFTHDTDRLVEIWNRFLLISPCENSLDGGLLRYADAIASMWRLGGESRFAAIRERMQREREALCDEARARRDGKVAK